VRDHPPLSPGELHLWWTPLSAAGGVTERLHTLLSEAERARAARYRFDRHRESFVLGRGTLRRLLEGYTGIPARELVFSTGPHGKPALANGDESVRFGFNYSDAGGHALYGFIQDAQIGVDLESLEREVSFEDIARRKFTRAESEAILSLPHDRRKAAFLACWTRKEGYGKAEGWGIHYALDSVELCADCDARTTVVAAGCRGAKEWSVRQVYPTAGFVGCVVHPAAPHAGAEPVFRYFGTRPGLGLE
jgi:4'-phosphopantetheinyl transferase